ncbi:MAG: DUF2202 domain-containing protein [Methanomicrobiaceae archaeon]|nr:DUF2202 domain-containing protein [Methanomicrobiaceae archaeon]
MEGLTGMKMIVPILCLRIACMIAISARTDQKDTTFVYEILMRGFRNHLRDFV